MHRLYKLTFLFLFLGNCSIGMAQNIIANQPFKGHFYNAEHRIHLYLDLYEESLTVPNYSFLGKINGYLNGNVYETWLLTSFETEQNEAHLHFSNDQGADTQVIFFTQLSDSVFSYKAIGNNYIRKVVGKKFVYLPPTMLFKRK